MITLTRFNQPQKTVVWSAITAVIFSTVFVLIAYFFLSRNSNFTDQS